jgi:receptor protein-tyrosine kinase/non-specific protein-tyrosine kinase
MAEIKGFPERRSARATGIPRDFADETRLPPMADRRSPVTERYRRLKTMLEHLVEDEERGNRTFVIASSREGEGKSLTALNLALVMAEERDRSVLLVDCDLHRPRLHQALLRPPRIGLMDVYEDRIDLEGAVLPLVKSRLHILPSGSVGQINPAEILKSARFRKMLDMFRQRYHRVVIDTPPVMRFVDSNILNEHADGMVFVIRAGLTSRQMVRKALDSVTNGRILGLVFNDARFTMVDRYYYGYDEYAKSYYDG